MKIHLLTVLVTAILATPVSADTTYYVGGNASFLKLDERSGGDEFNFNLTSLGMRLGAQFHPNFSAEFRFGFGIGDDTDEMTNLLEHLVDLEVYYGCYLRAGTDVGRFYPYLLAGWTSVSIDRGSNGFRSRRYHTTWQRADFSYGIGADMHINDLWAVNAEWGQYIETASDDVSGFRMGLVYSF